MSQFYPLLQIYTPDQVWHPIPMPKLAEAVVDAFGVKVPLQLQCFWEEVGTGYFGERELFFFGDGSVPSPRDSLITWNRKDWSRDFFDPPNSGGPLFFAETCFGSQIGFQYVDDICRAISFSVDTLRMYIVAEDFDAFFHDTLACPHSLVEADRLFELRGILGALPDGMHYAPIVSPLAGGSGSVTNFHFETPNVHVESSLATYRALKQLNPAYMPP